MTDFLKVALVAFNRPGYQSLALGYIRAFAEQYRALQGRAAFQTLDLDTDVDPAWAAYRILDLAPDVVGLSVSCWCARQAYEVARIVALARPETRIVLGGPEVTPIAEDVLRATPGVCAVVRGEGEETFAQLLEAIGDGRPAWHVAGVTAWRDDEVFAAPDRKLLELDRLPSPYLTGTLQPTETSAYLETFRGCPHRCGYCFEGKGSRGIRQFSRERVLAEIEAVASAPGVRAFSFIDPVFNLTPDRLDWLTEALAPYAARGMRLHTIEVDIERIDVPAAEKLRRAGVVSVETGPQTVGAKALETCKRPFDRERFVAGVRALRNVGISVECDLIIGLPGDTASDVLDGLDFLLQVDPGRIQASTLHVLPGTDLWYRAEELGLRFEAEPPHVLVASADMSFQQLRRAEVLALATQTEYDARI